MQEEENQDTPKPEEELHGAKKEVKEHASNLFSSIKVFLVSLVSIKEEIDYKDSPLRIEENIKFQGFNVWVLICSILIASIGLNSNSTAIIIGAMLISPLMGPIVGIGFSLGTNRFELLKRSILNFVIMMLVGLTASYIYFLLTPLHKAETEILARTSPTILDVLVAIFGGLAGAIAGTRKTNGLTVVPGVAIATALMPPLCTVGYGLATMQMDFALGAMYLFLLNSIIISISTTVFIRTVRFPLHAFVNKKKEFRAKILIGLFMIILIVPSVSFFITATQESIFESNATTFVKKVIRHQNSFIITKKIRFKTDSIPKIEILIGGKTVADTTIERWKETLAHYKIKNTELIIFQDIHDDILAEKIRELEKNSSEVDEENESALNAMIRENRIEAHEKDSLILSLSENIALRDSVDLDYKQISAEIKAMYSGINKMAFGRIIEENEEKTDTIPTLFIQWNNKIGYGTRNSRAKKIKEWLAVRTHNANIQIRQYN